MIIILFITKTATGPGGSVLGGIGPGGVPVVGTGGRGPGVGPGGLPLGAGGTGVFKPGKSELQAHVWFFLRSFVPNQHSHITMMSFFYISYIDYGAGGFGILPAGGMLSYSLQYKLNTA